MAGGLVDWGMEKSRGRTLAEAGARLVKADLELADSHLEDLEKGGENWIRYEFQTENWRQYREALAMKLSAKDFEAVAQAALDTMVLATHHTGAEPPPKAVGAVVVPQREHLAAGIAVLSRV